MALKGNLAELSIIDLIQVNCSDRKQARIRLRHDDKEASLFFEDGNIVHAEYGAILGEPALYEVMAWKDGTFELEKDVTSPRRTVNGNSAELLIEGMYRLDTAKINSGALMDEGSPSDDVVREAIVEMEKEMLEEPPHPGTGPGSSPGMELQTLVQNLRTLPGVEGAVLVARDGMVLADDIDESPEKEGAVAVFVGNAAEQIGETLGLGSLERGTVEVGKSRMLILQQPDYIVGLLLEERGSADLIVPRAKQLLK